VFSVADLKTQIQPGDEVWVPSFTMDDEPRFLGPPNQKPEKQAVAYKLAVLPVSKGADLAPLLDRKPSTMELFRPMLHTTAYERYQKLKRVFSRLMKDFNRTTWMILF